MTGRTNTGGGGKLFAVIGVTYPEGSVCTCVNTETGKTLKANNTTGQWAFSIPESGTWTVSCTKGTNTASESVSITAQGQSVKVELGYRMILFQSGTFSKIGGMSAVYPASVSVNELIRCTTNGNYWGLFTTSNPISAGQVDTLSIEIAGGRSWISSQGNIFHPEINICSTKPTAIANQSTGQHNGNVVAKASIAYTPYASNNTLTTIDPQTVHIDLSAISGDIYIVIRISGASSMNGDIDISSIIAN